MSMKKIFTVFLSILVTFFASAQSKQTQIVPQRKPLSHTVYDSWKEILFKSISPDGNFAAFTINPQDGDGKVVFYHLKTNAHDSIKRAAETQITFDSQSAV